MQRRTGSLSKAVSCLGCEQAPAPELQDGSSGQGMHVLSKKLAFQMVCHIKIKKPSKQACEDR